MQLNERQKGHIEGYAKALQDILYELTGGNNCAKPYDPATVQDKAIKSYAYNLIDGGRTHPLTEFNSVNHVTGLMLHEVVEEMVFSAPPTKTMASIIERVQQDLAGKVTVIDGSEK